MLTVERLVVCEDFECVKSQRFEVVNRLPEIGERTIFGETFVSVEKYNEDDFLDDPLIITCGKYNGTAEYYKLRLYDEDENIDRGCLYYAVINQDEIKGKKRKKRGKD